MSSQHSVNNNHQHSVLPGSYDFPYEDESLAGVSANISTKWGMTEAAAAPTCRMYNLQHAAAPATPETSSPVQQCIMNKVESSYVKNWFRHEELWWRTLSALLWCQLLVLPLLHLYWLPITTNPIYWLSHWVTRLSSGWVWLRVCTVSSLTLLLGVYHASVYTVGSCGVVAVSRVDAARTVALSPRHHAHAAALGALPALVVARTLLGSSTVYGSLLLYGNGTTVARATTTASHHSHMITYINESWVFLMLFLAFHSYYFILQYYLFNNNCVHIALNDQDLKYDKSRRGVLRILLELGRMWKALIIYHCAYWIFGGYIKSFITDITGLEFATAGGSGIWASLLLAAVLWKTAAFITVTHRLSALLIHVFISQAYQFPIGRGTASNLPPTASPTAEGLGKSRESYLNLYSALHCHDEPLIKMLALLDLSIIAQFSPIRRQHIFALTRIGRSDEPVSWLRVSQCLHGELSPLLEDVCRFNSTLRQSALASGTAAATSSTHDTTRIGDGSFQYQATPVPRRGVFGDGSCAATGVAQVIELTPPHQQRAPSSGSGRPQGREQHVVTNPGYWPRSPPPPQGQSEQLGPCTPAGLRYRAAASTSTPTASQPTDSASQPQQAMRYPSRGTTQAGVGYWFFYWMQVITAPLNRSRHHRASTLCPPSTLALILATHMDKVPGMQWLWGVQVHASSEALLRHYQLYALCIDSLSSLIVASYKEDRYGVVQTTTLHQSLILLIDLHVAFRDHGRLCGGAAEAGSETGQEPPHHRYILPHHTAASTSSYLYSTITRALNNIATTFGTTLKHVGLSSHYWQLLEPFIINTKLADEDQPNGGGGSRGTIK